MSNIQPIRPVTGVYPPCPPMPCPPPDCFGMSQLERCYDEVKRAQAFLTQMLKDIIACDPSILTGLGIAGVTNGSEAQPGMVGEWIQFAQTVAYPVTANTSQSVSLGALPAGDWDVWAWAEFTSSMTGALFSLAPQPAGFSGNLPALVETVAGDLAFLLSPVQRALTSVPSLIALTLVTNANGAGPAAGNCTLTFSARRMR